MKRTSPHETVLYFRHCILNGDLAGTMSCFAENAIYIDRDGNEITGLESIQKEMEHLCNWKPEIIGSQYKSTIIGDQAIWMDKWTMKATLPNGNPIVMNGATACLLKKNEEGNWVWLVDNPFAGPFFGIE